MPNRIVRDGILRSKKVTALSPSSELFYRRLLSVVDDFGRYYADPGMLLSDCFPTRPTWADDELITKAVEECRLQNLILIYEIADDSFLEVQGFDQRIRPGQKSRFPEPADFSGELRDVSARASTPTTHTTTPPNTTSPPNAAENFGRTPTRDFRVPLEAQDDSQYQEFKRACGEFFGGLVIESDWDWQTWLKWKAVDPTERSDAIAGIMAHKTAGSNPQIVRRPGKYLASGEWKRKISPPQPIGETKIARIKRMEAERKAAAQ